MINLCIIGAGDVVRERHALILKELKDIFHVSSIVTTRKSAFEKVQSALGYETTQVYNVEDIPFETTDAALIAVTPTATMDVATYLLRKQIPMYIEKPLANDAISGMKFVEDAINKKLPIIVGENFQKQERFNTAKSMIQACNHEVRQIFVRDNLKRGLRTNKRTDDELFMEHFVHIVASIREITSKNISMVLSYSKRQMGSISEYIIKCELEGEVPVEIQFDITNSWSEDRYFIMSENSDIKISHNYSYDTKMYTDIIEHYHGEDHLVEVRKVVDADSGMKSCWEEFTDLMQKYQNGENFSPSRLLTGSINDLQVREAVQLIKSTDIPIPVLKVI